MRLEKDSESLGVYLSWLLSESLAAKIRESAALATAAESVNKIQRLPFQGKLTPNQVLFDLYSEIAFSALAMTHLPIKVQFGDVFSPRANGKGAVGRDAERGVVQVDSADDLLLVIAPGCDLQRCSGDYEVMCVRGRIVKRAPDLADLLSPQSFFGKVEENFKHLFRRRSGQHVEYSLVEWTPKLLTTVKQQKLCDSAKFVRRARLNELFGQKVKEEALRQVGRIGVPVDPSFSSALAATIRLKKAGKKQYQLREVADTEFVSGIYVSANEQNPARVTLSEEFLRLFAQNVAAIQEAPDCPFTTKHLEAFRQVTNSEGTGLVLARNNELFYDGGFKIRFVSDFERGRFVADNEIVLYPRGRIHNKAADGAGANV